MGLRLEPSLKGERYCRTLSRELGIVSMKGPEAKSEEALWKKGK